MAYIAKFGSSVLNYVSICGDFRQKNYTGLQTDQTLAVCLIFVFFFVKLGFVMLRVINNFGFFVQLVLFWRLLQVRPGPPKLSQRRIFGDFWCKILPTRCPSTHPPVVSKQ